MFYTKYYKARRTAMGRLTTGEIQKISSRLNKKVDIPVLGEQKEQIILEKIIAQIDNGAYTLRG